MNKIFIPQQRRVPDQPHLKICREERYDGFPVLQQPGGLIEPYLGRMSSIINKSLSRHGRVFACRVDLHFPQFYHPVDGYGFSNQYFHKFIKTLGRRLAAYKAAKQEMGLRIHSVDFDYVWAREYGPDSNKPHFHLLLLFNGHAFNSLGHFSNAHESLYNRIGESWGEALGFHVAEGSKFVHFPEIGQYLVDSRNSDQVAKVFHRASYLAKVASKNFHDGFHVFGGSRV